MAFSVLTVVSILSSNVPIPREERVVVNAVMLVVSPLPSVIAPVEVSMTVPPDAVTSFTIKFPVILMLIVFAEAVAVVVANVIALLFVR